MNKMIKRILLGLLLVAATAPLQLKAQELKLSSAEKKADTYVFAQEFSKAEEEYLSILQKKSTDQQTLNRVNVKLAMLYHTTRRFSEAESKFEEAMVDITTFTPNQAAAFISTLIQVGKPNRAANVIAIFTAKHPFSSDRGMLNLKDGLKYLMTDAPDTASMAAIKAPFNQPGSNFWSANYDNGILYIHIGNDEKAMLKGAEFYYYDGHNSVPFTKISTTMQAGPATFAKDGMSMMYTDNRYGDKAPRAMKDEKLVANTLRIMELSYNPKKQTWGSGKELFKDKKDFSICHPSLSDDGNTLYFSANFTGTEGGMDLYLSRKGEKGWGTPVNLGKVVNTAGEELFANVYGNTLSFASNGHPGFGGQDVYSVMLDAEGFPLVGTLKHHPYPINTIYNDYAFMFQNESTGFFSSDRPNGEDLDAIYAWMKRVQVEKPKMEAAAPKLKPVEPTISKPSAFSEIRERYVEPEPEPVDVAKEMIAGNIRPDATVYYGFNKSTVDKDGARTLDIFIKGLKGETPRLLILGYADAIGSSSSNALLSEKRAQVVKDYLVKKGYPADNIEVIGKGQLILDEAEQLDANDDKEKLAPARKAEIKIL